MPTYTTRLTTRSQKYIGWMKTIKKEKSTISCIWLFQKRFRNKPYIPMWTIKIVCPFCRNWDLSACTISTQFPGLLPNLELTTGAWFYHQSAAPFSSLHADHTQNGSVCLGNVTLPPSLCIAYSPRYWEMKPLLYRAFSVLCCYSSLCFLSCYLLWMDADSEPRRASLKLRATAKLSLKKKKGIYKDCYFALGPEHYTTQTA